MRSASILAALVLATQGMPGVAQETNEVQRLLRIIEDQQRRLDSQEAQLQEQKKALQELYERVTGLRAPSAPPAATPATASPSPASGAQPSPSSYPELKTASAAGPAPAESWPGSFEVPAINTRFKISGFVEMDVTHDNDAILTPAAFVTSAIVTRDASAAEGVDGQTHFSVQASRLQFETRTPIGERQLSTMVAVDFFNDFFSTTPELRLRQAYGELSDILFGGDLLVGQDWSTYANLYAIPNVLDFQGVNAVYGTRHPMVRWTRPLGSGWTMKLAAEAPDVRNFEGAGATSRWPDGVATLGWQNEVVNLQAGFLARDLRASANDTGSTVGDFGWAASLAGRVYLPGALKQDFLTFSVVGGEGFGGVLNDVPADATYDPTSGDFGAIPALAWYAGYQHWWSPKFYSVLCYGQIRHDNFDYQSAAAFLETEYGSANLTWVPTPHWLVGIEMLYGSREDHDGAKGEVVRTQFTTRFSF